MAWGHGFQRMRLDCDSKSAIHLIHTSKDKKHVAYQVTQQISSLMQQAWEVELCHIYRKANRLGDAFAQLGYD